LNPDYARGGELAEKLYQWLGRPDCELHRSSLGWPWAERLASTQVAGDLGVCPYVKVPPPWSPDPDPGKPEDRHGIEPSTYTRRAIAFGANPDLEGRPIGRRVAQILFGGQLSV